MKKIMTIFVLLLLAVSLFGMGQQDQAAVAQDPNFPMSVMDSFDREIILEAPPARIVSLAPSLTEIIFALGAEDSLVGRTDFCDFPAEVSGIPAVGSLMEPSIETIVSMNPDLVLASTHFQKETLAKLDELGIPTVILYVQNSFESVYDMILQTGAITGTQTKAEEIVGEMQQTVSLVKERVASAESKPTVYYVVSFGEWGDFTATGETFIHQLITMAGGENIAADVEGWAFSLEKIVEQDPDIMICSINYNTKEALQTAEHYKDLRAVQNGQLHAIDNNLLDRQGYRLADGLLLLAEVFHPDLF